MTSKLHELSKGANDQSENSEYLDYKVFAALLYDLFKLHEDNTRVREGRFEIKDLLCQLPLDPDSRNKQIWDIFCMVLLLYCSFSVPFGIAFDSVMQEQQNAIKDNFDFATDLVFITDICLNFITAWDNQGIVIREFSLIADNYLRTWFVLDFSGSFPFDRVITSIIDADQQAISSATMLRGLKLIRMLKLIRALKFMNKLEKLKQQEGYEAFAAIITLLNAAFALFFTAHVLGCFYTILMSFEEGDNWLITYNPDLVGADISIRYVIALYWAIVTIRHAPHPPLFPRTHARKRASSCPVADWPSSCNVEASGEGEHRAGINVCSWLVA
jgi:hyperpolarization activated cyclic nucleotide-gated potassium channel 2